MFMIILFLPSCKSRGDKLKDTGKDNERLQWKLQLFHVSFSHQVRTENGWFSWGWIYDAKCKTILEVAREVISEGNKTLCTWVGANDIMT